MWSIIWLHFAMTAGFALVGMICIYHHRGARAAFCFLLALVNAAAFVTYVASVDRVEREARQ